jgi:hypothetical protein
MDQRVTEPSHHLSPIAAFALAILMVAIFAQAQQRNTAAGTEVVRATLLNANGWVLAFTYSLPPEQLDRWLQAPSRFEERKGKLVITVNDPSHGRFESEVTVLADGISYINHTKAQIRLIYDPVDSSTPFKGEKDGYSFWLRRQN